MDIQPDGAATQPISDDQELAKALAGIADEPAAGSTDPGFIATPAPGESAPAPAAATPAAAPAPAPTPALPGDLESIKQTALTELRPLMDHVELPPEEKFDTYLMLIRSTDDPTLIGPAHAVAQTIPDEKRRAEALLDIVKEIDFLSHRDQPA